MCFMDHCWDYKNLINFNGNHVLRKIDFYPTNVEHNEKKTMHLKKKALEQK